MVPVGPTADACSSSGAVDIHGVVQMLSGQGRQNMVSVLDVAMPAPALTGKCEQFFWLISIRDVFDWSYS